MFKAKTIIAHSAWIRISAALIFAAAVALPAQAIPVTVVGTSNPWLAGMPNGATTVAGDIAPAQSPVLVSGLNLGWGGYLTFTNVMGGVSNGPTFALRPPDGETLVSNRSPENGISGFSMSRNSLIGVFLNDAQPNLSAAPAALGTDKNFLTLSPLLKQVFFIGDGQTSGAVIQQFLVPVGATRLFLGTMDGLDWANNSGAFSLEVTQVANPPGNIPEPNTLWMALIGALAIYGVKRQRKLQA